MMRVSRLIGGVGFWLSAVFCVLIALVSYRFVPLGVEAAMDIVAHNLDGNALALYGHIGVAPIALAVMPFQFMAGLRKRRPGLHRWMGRIYVAAILISGLAGLQLAFVTTAGTFAGVGFGLLALVWLFTTGMAFVFAVRRQINRHRTWMIRSAALTFAAVTLRIYLGISMVYGIEFDIAYSVIAWMCWVPNALLAEIYLARSNRGNNLAPRAAV